VADHIPLSLSDLSLLLHFIPADSRDVWVEVGGKDSQGVDDV